MSEKTKLRFKIEIPMKVEINASSEEDAQMKLGEMLGDSKQIILDAMKQRGIEMDEDIQKFLDELTVEESSVVIDDIKVTKGKELSRDVN